MQSEPLVTVATITAAVSALIGLFVSFGITITDAQQAAILAVIAVLAPIVVVLFARSKVDSHAEVAARKADDGTLIAGPAAIQPDGTQVAVVAYDHAA